MESVTVAEKSLLGAMLLGREAVLMAEDAIQPQDFREPVHEVLFRRMVLMVHEEQPVDLVTVSDALTRHGEAKRLPTTLLPELAGMAPSTASIPYYAEIISKAALRRRLHVVGTQITQASTDPEQDEFEVVEKARAAIDDVRKGDRGMKLRTVGEGVHEMLLHMDDPIKQVPTPWPGINRFIGGMRPGQLIVVAARPSVGKSVMGMQLALRLASKGGAVAFHSLEMGEEELGQRILAFTANIDLSRIIRKQMTDTDLQKAAQAKARLDRTMIYVDDRSTVTITDIQRHARSVARSGYPLAGIVVDYLQLMSPPAGDKRNRQEFVADMSRQLKVLAKELGVPVIALSQLNRGSTSREDQMPKISDLRESGAIEQDADVVILMHREIMGDNRNDLTIAVAKVRNGTPGAIDATFWGHYARIEDPEGWD